MPTSVTQTATCATCAHCDTSDRWVTRERYEMPDGSHQPTVFAGACTRPHWYYNGDHVAEWMAGCPVYEPREVTP